MPEAAQTNVIVDHNYISSFRSTGGASPGFSQYSSIYMRGVFTNFMIKNNTIVSGQNSIYPYYASGSYGSVINNIINTKRIGLSIGDLNPVKVYHNTFYSDGNTAASFSLYTFGNAKGDVRNNHFIYQGGGVGGVMYFYEIGANLSNFDYNHFSVPAGLPLFQGYYPEDNLPNFAAFRARYPQFRCQFTGKRGGILSSNAGYTYTPYWYQCWGYY